MEALMARGYDAALRNRVIKAVEAGSSARKAGERFDVGVATAIRWVRRWRATGSPMGPPSKRKGSILDPHRDFIHGLRCETPEISCQAIADSLAEECGLKGHETTVWYFFKREGITFKKNPVCD